MTPRVTGKARFAFPPDLARTGVEPAQMDLTRAELRFGLSDPRGLGANPQVIAGGRPLRLQPGGGSSGGRGFFAWLDATGLDAPADRDRFRLRLPRQCGAQPRARRPATRAGRSTRPGRTQASAVTSCPARATSDGKGFDATYRIGNLALGRSLVSTGDAGASNTVERVQRPPRLLRPLRRRRAARCRPRRSA